MGLDQIAGWLEAAGVPPGAVVVGDDGDDGDDGGPGAPDAVWRIRAAGEGEWEVFWTEDGTRRAWVRFDDEATACFALLGRLTWARLVRGRP